MKSPRARPSLHAVLRRGQQQSTADRVQAHGLADQSGQGINTQQLSTADTSTITVSADARPRVT
ncbi:hypothetical protein ADK47_32305 [Streptomyces rimosus subsp. rimosus]|nr:hypothetical protein ADK84_10735 [Streptomyces sp. NRRL WC-3701]KOT67301.1 hypothetical protein ADK44_03905 [Streptomyces rimosus subsp. rimosus]QDA02855.1 hypothetical protein CTZ40_02745 [Streptomyces rimosus]KOT69908.1 hypothetical protein ADK45_05560 [Streptomyces rimosus subsp. rimosus]KOT71082.1 hypothetical protein ADK47_32305 [Streptomyces rimosus subsp. rimosus]